ncbi:MAG: hypothetical protein MJ089_08130 [Ruminococcus sp.]|nr:hypothetical protein [Ruminococcus sp.]
MSGSAKKEFGDYQTPLSFAINVCGYLKKYMDINPKVIIEPTCGIGNFIHASLSTFENVERVYGIEINEKYTEICKQTNNNDERLEVYNENIFTFNTRQLCSNCLIIGNPPWVTNSELVYNLPPKTNFKNLSGMNAMTGESNFDICEYIILKLIEEFNGTESTIAMLCKTSVARNVLLELERNNRDVKAVKIVNFNASKIFNICVSACLLIIDFSKNCKNNKKCDIVDIDNPEKNVDILKIKNGSLISEMIEAEDFDGICELEWRQGVKHDVSKIMELVKVTDDKYRNGNGEEVELEKTIVFPLLKSSHFKKPIIKENFKKYVIVTQKKARQDTSYIEQVAPKTWEYLNDNKELFEKRKSSIYNGAPAFSMFGVGDYSYSKYKIGVSGFYKKALFCLVYNRDNLEHSVMGDDTSYFLDFEDYDLAYSCMLLLNSERVQRFLRGISFQDAKRPYTKKVLSRICLKKVSDTVTLQELIDTEKNLGLEAKINNDMYNKFKHKLTISSKENYSICG